jgi:hypothetical protein
MTDETVRLEGEQPLPLGHVMTVVREYRSEDAIYTRLRCDACDISALISASSDEDKRSLVDIVRNGHEAATMPEDE